jgi:hypothetical protein
MPQTNNKSTQASIEEIQKIYDLFMIKLNKLKGEKNEIINSIIQRIDEEKVAEKLKELKDRY